MDYERLVAKHKDAVYRQMVRVCGNHDDAEDVLVQALLNAYRASGSLRDEYAFRSWVSSIGRRICNKLRNREALEPILRDIELEGIADPSEADPLGEIDTESCVKKAVHALPERLREVFLLDVEGQTGLEIADELDLSLAAVKSRLHRARSQIRTLLDEGLLVC